MAEEEPMGGEEEFTDEDVAPDVLGEVYVCSSCGAPLTEIPLYNRFYCENCGLHY